MKRATACLQFKRQLIELYKESGIITAFNAYLGFIKAFGLEDRYREYTDWQYADMCMSLYNPKISPLIEALETAWSYTRRGGKSRGLTVIAEFLSLLGYQVVWRAPHSDQLVQAAEWFSMNPFTREQKVRTQGLVKVFGSPDISIAVLSEGRIASREANVLIYDEGGSVMNHHINYEYYKNSRPMIAAAKFKIIIHASTDCLGSVFNEELNTLKEKSHKLGTKLTSTHPWRDTHWITEKWIESEKQAHLNCDWYIDQNYNCIAVVRGGRVFKNIITVGSESGPRNQDGSLMFPYGFLEKIQATNGGTDFNGVNVGHYLVKCTYDDDYVYVLDEINFWDLFELFDHENISLELEDELFNIPFTDQTKRMGLSCIYQPWKKEVKASRVQWLVDRKIVIDQYKTPLVYRNLVEAGYDELQRLPTLKKRSDQHGLDGLLHCGHDVGGKIYVQSHRLSRPPILGGTRPYNPLRDY